MEFTTFTCYSPTIVHGPTVSQLKKNKKKQKKQKNKQIWRSINKPPWEGLRKEEMRY